MTRIKAGVIAMSLAACLLAARGASPQANPQGGKEDAPDLQPRFIWGAAIVKFVAGEVFSTFNKWLVDRVSPGAAPDSGKDTLLDSLNTRLRENRDTTGGAAIVRNSSMPFVTSPQAAAITVGDPSRPIEIEGGRPNYQGAHIAVVGVARDGGVAGLRAVRDGFRTGERFKLRVVSTFGGLMVIDNINPRGESRQIYPAERDAVVALRPGGDTLLPLAADQYFEFARATGEEQLVISLRDARAVGRAASGGKIYRKDLSYGSNFVQEVGKDAFPAISESIRLVHR